MGTTTTYSFLPNQPFTNAFTYDAASNRTGFAAPDGSTNAYSYDTLNRLTTLGNSWAGSFGFSYDALSRRTQSTRPNGVTTNYSYDKLSRLLSVLHQSCTREGALSECQSGPPTRADSCVRWGCSTIDGAVYTLDAAGNRTSKADELAGVTSNYSYDAIYELTQVTQGANTTESYSYNAVGNRTASLGMGTYTTNSSNELTAVNGVLYGYDNNGNTVTRTDSNGTTQYTWDFENRLTQVTLPSGGGTVSFKYDPFGRRIYKQSPSATSIFAYDGDSIAETTNQSGTVVTRFAQGQNIDEPMAESSIDGTSYYEQDGLGSVTSVSNASGAYSITASLDSYGNITSGTQQCIPVSRGVCQSVPNPFFFTGREFDLETNLLFYRARYYDPTAGRFIGEDPLRFFVGDANFYAYVFNNPTIWEDPSGYSCHCTYSQATGHLVCKGLFGNVIVDVFGYSGIGLGLNNPSTQAVQDVGPIPTGTYLLGNPVCGALGCPQIPLRRLGGRFRFPTDRGPNSFLIHAENPKHPGSSSTGCIIIDKRNRDNLAGCGGGLLDVTP